MIIQHVYGKRDQTSQYVESFVWTVVASAPGVTELTNGVHAAMVAMIQKVSAT